MAKIISRQYLGLQNVYDIGVVQDHNFLLSNGLVASNCFNKSHSTAYGYVTYQTAYLKANYPVEYMAALLTANSGDQDKVQRYIATCLSMNIQVEPPDINRSGVDFTPLKQSILFGLSAVRNVGQGAIEAILAARDEGGPFKSLADLCDRVDTRVVNRRALEALIHCGAWDRIEANRRQLMADLNLILEWAQSRAKDRASGQGNLFDLLGMATNSPLETSNSFESAPKAPPVEDYLPAEKLKLEKELLGFYVSDHPLKEVTRSAKVLAPISLESLEQYVDKSSVSAIVILTEVKHVITKRGDRMAILQIEDLTGKSEAVIFPKNYEALKDYLETDARLIVWGKVDRRDEQVQFIIEDAEPIENVKMVMVELAVAQASDIQEQHRLKTILLEQRREEESPKIPVVAIVATPHERKFVSFGSQFRVQDAQTTVQALIQAGFQCRADTLLPAHKAG
ncbi:OB-fold nucleic acid binding domain-containing protein [Trichothermofontia sichuanensis B231]|uniref:helix-hairpin-helix domain-containing protein n=1 Tax=Trichothermofontia sichuanensis TaxID=3045816 RepID=UPI0022481A2C|nr:OB-fold nucleic acid binding domain-containing protein [Trichothermofontia sichuanensis]UZQ53900.1 OB-fold nucleic acid binding domain-containing protein [Trichothermofontia sichuanensis B231]